MMFTAQTMRSRGEARRWCLWAPHFLQIIVCHVTTDATRACVQSSSTVNCRNLSLSSVPPHLPGAIRTLDLSHNFIQNLTNVSMSKLDKLEDLDLHDNHLEVMEAGTWDVLPKLRSLNLASNRLWQRSASHRGALASLRSLKSLNLAENNLDGEAVLCYLSNVTSLVHLDLSRNAIVALFSGMFDGVPRLSALDLSNNFIDEIEGGTFDSLRDLRVLNLAENAIRCISSFDLPQLRSLNLSSNMVEFFLTKDAAEEPVELVGLDLSHNRLLHFPVLTKFQTVQHVNLSGNAMAELVPSWNVTEEAASWYEAIVDLDLPRAVETSLSRLSNVKDLNLSNNKLADVPWNYLSKMSKLVQLSLAGNCLQNLAARSSAQVSDPIKSLNITLKSLKVIDLQANSIRFIPRWIFHFLPKIQQINLKNNNVRFCSSHPTGTRRSAVNQHDCSVFSGAPNLRYLNLQRNGLTRLPPGVFEGTPLVSLDLSHNLRLDIEDEALEELSQSLRELLLSNNGMNDSQANLPCLQALKSLDLSNNRLSGGPNNPKCSSVENLDLRNNSLRSLSEVTTSRWMMSLKNVSISGNPFSCCSLAWLNLLVEAKIHIEDLEEAQCAYEGGNRRVPVRDTQHIYHCIHLTGEWYLKVGVIVISGSFTLLSVICYVHKKRGGRFCTACKIRSSKVAPEGSATTKSSNADRKQVCCTVSVTGLD